MFPTPVSGFTVVYVLDLFSDVALEGTKLVHLAAEKHLLSEIRFSTSRRLAVTATDASVSACGE